MRELAEYVLARGLEAVLGRMPEPAARAAGDALGRLARRPLGVRRRTVESHLAAAFPDRDAAWVRRTGRACYRHFGREAAALARTSRLDPTVLAGEAAGSAATGEVVRDAVRRGPGALVVTGHVGNWELAGAFLAGLGLPVSAVVKRQGNPRVQERVQGLRRRLGVEPVGMAEAGRRIPPALEEGRVVALVADQDAGRRGVFVPFLGRPASTFRGPARLALEHRVPLVFGALLREGGRYRALARPVWSPGGGLRPGAAEGGGGRSGVDDGASGAGGDESALTRAWVAELERTVRSRPEQYFWFHRRWKTRPRPDRERS